MLILVLVWIAMAIIYLVTFVRSLQSGVAKLGGVPGGSVSKLDSPRMYVVYLCVQLLVAGFCTWMAVSTAISIQ